MAFPSMKLTEMPLRTPLPFTSYSSSLNLFFSAPKPSFRFFKPFSSFRTGSGRDSYPWDRHSSSSFRAFPSPSEKVLQSDGNDKVDVDSRYLDKDKGQSAIERIVLRLRNLGLGSDDEDEDGEEEGGIDEVNSSPVTGEERLGDLWVRPDTMLMKRAKEEDVLPWERQEAEAGVAVEEGGLGVKKRRVKALTLAELTIEDEELRRLRRMGMYLRERINVPKAGITQAVLEKIHDKWRKS